MIRRGAVVLLAVCGLSMCAWTDEPATKGKAPAKEAEPEVIVGAPKSEILDTGKDPKRKIKFTYTAGDTHYIETINKTVSEMSVAGQQMKQAQPTTHIIIEHKIVAVNKEGIATCESRYLKAWAEAGSPQSSMLNAELGKMVGTVTRTTLSPAGAVLSSEMSGGEDMNPTSRQMMKGLTDGMKQMAMAMPTEPMGAGGKWKSIVPVDIPGMFKLDTEVTITLTEVTDKGGAATTVSTAKVADKTFTPPGMPQGMTANIKSMNVLSKGEQIYTWSNPLAATGLSSTDTDGVIAIDSPQGPMEMTMKSQTSIQQKKVEKPADEKKEEKKDDVKKSDTPAEPAKK